MIGWATPEMLPALRRIWTTCFGDSDAYTDYLFGGLIRPENVVALTGADGTPEAMLCVQPFSLAARPADGSAEITLPAAYIYGVATLPEHRGRGLSTALLDETHHLLTGRGCALSALVPASEKLFGFYGKRGYETAFSLKKTEVLGGEIPHESGGISLFPAPLEELVSVRERAFADCGSYVRWEKSYLAYIGGECAAFGGETLRVTAGGQEGYAVCYPDGGTVYVKELAWPHDRYPEVLTALHDRYGADRYVLYLRADCRTSPDKVLPFAMVRWYDKEKRASLPELRAGAAYIAHVLD